MSQIIPHPIRCWIFTGGPSVFTYFCGCFGTGFSLGQADLELLSLPIPLTKFWDSKPAHHNLIS